MDEQPTPLEDLTDAVQAFVNATEDKATLVAGAVLVFEVVHYDDDGDELRRISYTTPGFGASLAGSIGLLDAGLHIVRRDVIGEGSSDE